VKIYTHTGDDGTTSLSGGRRVPKHSLRVEAYGSVDELIAWISLIRAMDKNAGRSRFYLYIQDQLMRCASALAFDNSNARSRQILPDDNCTEVIEKAIDEMDENLPSLKHFILPSGDALVSHCHIARCVCRRAERAILRLNEVEEVHHLVTRLLNRLSDFLFILSRSISFELGNEEVIWPVDNVKIL
jgi:cob(I)alamin adenosyltransferase